METQIVSDIGKLAPSHIMHARFLSELAGMKLHHGPGSRLPVTEAEIECLPAAAQRLMRFMRVVGKPRHWSFEAHWFGSFRMAPHQKWVPCEAWQYNTRLGIARVFHMRFRHHRLMPLLVRDLYVQGQGQMSGRVLDAIALVDKHDEKISIGELVTYLNDAILFAPSMLLGPETTWAAVDQHAFDVTLADAGRSVKARVFVDERGAVTNFSTTDRFVMDPRGGQNMIRAEWTTPIAGWDTSGDEPSLVRGKAVWHLPSGPFEYADISLKRADVAFDVCR